MRVVLVCLSLYIFSFTCFPAIENSSNNLEMNNFITTPMVALFLGGTISTFLMFLLASTYFSPAPNQDKEEQVITMQSSMREWIMCIVACIVISLVVFLFKVYFIAWTL